MSLMNPDREALRRLDKAHLWHPFTQMRDWCASEEDPLVIVSGEGPTATSAGQVIEDLVGHPVVVGRVCRHTRVPPTGPEPERSGTAGRARWCQ